MKIIKLILMGFLLTVLFGNASCQKNTLKKSPLTGTWIESGKKSDTIVFSPEYDGQHPVFELKRGFRITEGYQLPDYYSGYYWYKLSQDSIALYWFLSSASFQSYYFKILPGDGKFAMGNFFINPENQVVEKDTLIFIRLE
ncbi:MAG: hypothetical protein V1775_07290 [Bacteroidota bacterium]